MQSILKELFYGNINPNAKQFVRNSEYSKAVKTVSDCIRYPQRGVCLYKCGNERYNLMVHALRYKEKLFGKAGGR